MNNSFRYGGSTDQITKGDWDGDGRDGIAIFRPSTGYWYFDFQLDGVVDRSFRYGGSTDRIIIGDWDGDGRDGIAIFRPSTGYWYFDFNLDGIIDRSFRYGGSTDTIIKGDWDGDGGDGIAIFRPSTGYWYFDFQLDGVVDRSFRYGGSTDQILVGDWYGDGSDGIAIFRPSTGYWYFDNNLDGTVDVSERFGGNGDIPVTGRWAITPQTTYKVYAEVGERSDTLLASAQGFWDNIHNAQNGGITWTDSSGHGVIVKHSYDSCPIDNGIDICPRASHWTSNASQWIGQADFLFYSGHGFEGGINFTDDYGNRAYSENMGLNSTGRVKWAVFDSCKTLNGDNYFIIISWAHSFNNGLHMLLGWDTDVAPSDDVYINYRGAAFAKLMRGIYPGDTTRYTMIDAWYLAGVYTYQENPGSSSFDVRNAVMYADGCRNDHLPGWGEVCIPNLQGAPSWEYSLVWAKDSQSRTISRLLNLTVGNYSLTAFVPVVNDTVMLYEPVKSGYTKEWVSSLAKNLGMSGDIRETENAFYAGDTDAKQYLFVIQKNSSMILFRKTSSRSGIVQSTDQSISEANTFLQKNNLMPSGDLESRVER